MSSDPPTAQVDLRTLSHELRTPLNGILGLTRVLLQSELEVEQRDLLETIFDNGNMLVSMLTNFLDYEKIQTGAWQSEDETFSPLQLIEDVLDLWIGQASIKGLTLHFIVQDPFPESVETDRGGLRQVLSNLVGNAIKFTAEGQVWIEAGKIRDGEEGLWFEVRDTGIGIPENRIEDLFEPFVQADARIHSQFGGTGLGLSICKKIVEGRGGKISAVPQASGACFRFEFPGKVSDTIGPEGKHEVEVAAGLDLAGAEVSEQFPMKILVGEDQAINRKVIDLLLGRLGYEPEFAENGHEVIEMVSKGNHDLILMDVEMPGMSGLEATKKIRSWLHSQPAIIALSGHSGSKHEHRCFEAGMDAVLTKPVRIEALVHLLQRAHDDPDPIDWDAFAEFRTDLEPDTELVAELVASFKEEVRDEMRSIEKALERPDPHGVRQGLHKVKSLCTALWGTTASAVADKMEQLAIAGDLAAVREELPHLRAALTRLRWGLDRILKVGLDQANAG